MERCPVARSDDTVSTVREFYLPELPRLLPRAYHPQAAPIEIASNGWIRRFLGETFGSEAELLLFLRQRNGLYGALAAPKASAERAQDIADWYQFVTVIDTSVSDGSGLGANGGRAREIFASIVGDFDTEGHAADDFPFGRAANDLWRRISPGLSEAQVNRFVASLEAFLRGCATEIDTKLTDGVPDYETCMAVRQNSFGCDFIELLTEYGANVDMTEVIPSLTDVHLHGRRQMILVNDLLSWRKEHREDDRMTAVRVLVSHEGLPLQQAVDRICELVEHHERSYIAARDEVLAGPLGQREDVRAYLTAFDYLIGGSQEFEYLTPRYYGDGSVWDGSTSGWLDLDAPIARFRPEPAREQEPSPEKRCPAVAAPGESATPPSDRRHADTPPAASRPASERSTRGSASSSWSLVPAPGAVPVLGHVLQLWRHPLRLLESLPADGEVIEIKLGPKRVFLAHHPDVVHHVLTDAHTYDKGGPLFDKARQLVGNGLVASLWEPHRRQRRIVQPAFHPSRFPRYVSLMTDEIEAAMASWQQGRRFDVSDAMHALTLKITARTMFATTAGSRAVNEVAYCMPIIMRGVYKRMVAPFGLQEKLPTAHNRAFDEVRVRMRRLIRETVEAYHDAGSVDRGDLLSMLLNARDDETGQGLTTDEVHDQVMTLLIGGTETSGNTMAWVFHLLAKHPEIESRLHAEVDEVLGGRMPGFEDLPRLGYTTRVITETLRMYPPAWLLSRVTTREVELGGLRLRPGTIVLYSPYALGHNPMIFENPSRFDPDRWLPERSADLPRGVNLPFGGGGRKCIGDSLGMAETTAMLASIASRWRLRSVPGTRAGTQVPRASLGTGPLLMVPEPREHHGASSQLTSSVAS